MSRWLNDQELRELRTACTQCKRLFVYLPEEKRDTTPDRPEQRIGSEDPSRPPTPNYIRVVVTCPEGHETIVGVR